MKSILTDQFDAIVALTLEASEVATVFFAPDKAEDKNTSPSTATTAHMVMFQQDFSAVSFILPQGLSSFSATPDPGPL